MIEALFWLAAAGVGYAYVGYPLLLAVLARLYGARRPGVAGGEAGELPALTLIVPVYNEEAVIARKLDNIAALEYPRDRLQVLVVSDGSTDRTVQIVSERAIPGVKVLTTPQRGGKARAMNCALEFAQGDIVCFSDASIMLEAGALKRIVAPFGDPRIGCVSGEDVIDGGGGEGAYGRYELGIRRMESKVHSIVGASGSFYAQRRSLCRPFREGFAPDFWSVLVTVEQGARAVAEPSARGSMTSLGDSGAEFRRKVRTILRGIATLAAYRHLLNPFSSGVFALLLLSHKLMRWLVPFFLIVLLVSSGLLAGRPFYALALALQVAFYLLAALAWRGMPAAREHLAGRIALYFTLVNLATAAAWWKFASGARQEIWEPTRRESAPS